MLRGFTDSTGVEWRVWEVFPTRAGVPNGAETLSRTSLKETAFANGWLCFESADAKRRLAPIPPGWEFVTGDVLAELCLQATVVPLRRRYRIEADLPAQTEAPGAA
jgi:hypothetical protein